LNISPFASSALILTFYLTEFSVTEFFVPFQSAEMIDTALLLLRNELINYLAGKDPANVVH